MACERTWLDGGNLIAVRPVIAKLSLRLVDPMSGKMLLKLKLGINEAEWLIEVKGPEERGTVEADDVVNDCILLAGRFKAVFPVLWDCGRNKLSEVSPVLSEDILSDDVWTLLTRL